MSPYSHIVLQLRNFVIMSSENYSILSTRHAKVTFFRSDAIMLQKHIIHIKIMSPACHIIMRKLYIVMYPGCHIITRKRYNYNHVTLLSYNHADAQRIIWQHYIDVCTVTQTLWFLLSNVILKWRFRHGD